jgi:hypothetical protein
MPTSPQLRSLARKTVGPTGEDERERTQDQDEQKDPRARVGEHASHDHLAPELGVVRAIFPREGRNGAGSGGLELLDSHLEPG